MTTPVTLHLPDEAVWLLAELARVRNVTPAQLVTHELCRAGDELRVFWPGSPAGELKEEEMEENFTAYTVAFA